MKNFKNAFSKCLSLLLVAFLAIAFTGCTTKEEVSVNLSASSREITKGEVVQLTVEVKGTENGACTFTISDPDTLQIDVDFKVTVKGDIETAKMVDITATSTVDTTKTSTVSLLVKPAPVVKEQVTVVLNSEKETIMKGEAVKFSTIVTNATDETCTYTVSNPTLVSVSTTGLLSVIGDVAVATTVTVTATSNEDPTVKAEKSITVLPLVDSEKVSIRITTSAERLTKGESLTVTVTVEGNDNVGYSLAVSDEDLLTISGNTISFNADIILDKYVTITATSTADPTAQAKKTILLIAPRIEGQVGELTSTMIEQLGNTSITVTGKLVDYYQDFNQVANSSTHTYFMTVKMNDGAWLGEWYAEGNVDNKIVTNYRRGEQTGVDSYGNTGKVLEQIYIDKNNTVARKVIKDYLSIPAIWEAQHLYNHIASLSISKFTYDSENELYKYNADLLSVEDAYLMTYLGFSLTPLLEDTLVELYFKVENGAITKMIAQTEVLYYGSDTNEDADAMSYSTIELEFSEIGTTEVDDPAPYAAPTNASILAAAIEKMASAKNYTFRTNDQQTQAPSTDEGDYTLESVRRTSKGKVTNYTSSQGTVGYYGLVTEDAVLIADTIQYTYTMDGKSYRTEYFGYKQNANGTYDEFKYQSKHEDVEVNTLVGTKLVNGNIFDAMPKFDFSPNVFEFAGSSQSNGKTLYTFRLQDASITRDLALEVSQYKYADDASESSTVRFTIVVDGDGNLVSTVYPYSISSGTYAGNCTTTYSDFGTTTLEEDTFDGYIPRTIKTNWNQFIVSDYSPTFSTLNQVDTPADQVLASFLGESAALVPSPEAFFNVIGDNYFGPWFDWVNKGSDAEGNNINHGALDLTMQSTEYDENGVITNYEELMAAFTTEFGKLGFAVSQANTDMTGGATGRSNRYLCLINGDVQIVIENNNTKYLWISIYHTGDWTLRR